MSSELREFFQIISVEANGFFEQASLVATKKEDVPFGTSFYASANHYWGQLPDDLKVRAQALVNKVLPACASLAFRAKNSPLAGAEDLHDIRLATKSLRAALQLRKFHYSRPEVVHDEGTVLGLRPAEQAEDWGLTPSQASIEFNEKLQIIASVVRLVDALPQNGSVVDEFPQKPGSKCVAGTAFIMMWMDPDVPELTDVLDVIKDACRKFDIRATRADDIEHEGQITDRVINEIRSSEFIFADLTGARPNVYYETGYAHALGKRVILFKKSGTRVHFDLVGYNCPEYKNMRELRELIINRLIHITNRKPRSDEAT